MISIAVFCGAAVLGFAAVSPVGPDRLRIEIERGLSEAVGGPVAIGRARLELGLWPRVVAANVRAWPSGPEPRLRIARARADVRALPLLIGRVRLRRLVLDGAQLTLERSAEGLWSPASHPEEAGASPHPRELLQPLISLETSLRNGLRDLLPADHLVIRDARVDWVDASLPGGPVRLSLVGLDARMSRSRFRGYTRLEARARLVGAGGELGTLEWQGSQKRGGRVRIALASTGLELSALEPWVSAGRPDASLAGSLSGALVFESSEPGRGQLEIDLLVRDLRAVAPRAGRKGGIRARRAVARGVLEIGREELRLRSARIEGGTLDVRLDGRVDRPLRPESSLDLALVFRDVEVDRARKLVAWLPDRERETALGLLEPVVSGRMVRMAGSGNSSLSGWQALLGGRLDRLPSSFRLEAEVERFVVRVGESDRFDQVRGRVEWADDRAVLSQARGRLNGSPVPRLEVTLDGVSNLFSSDPGRRELRSGAKPLLGLGPLWKVLAPESSDPAGMSATLRLEIDELHHPMFLWPLESLTADVEPVERGVHIVTTGASWGGIPVEGEAEWLFEPEEALTVHLTAAAPRPQPPAHPDADGWVRGRFEVGGLYEGPWRQKRASGEFHAEGETIALSGGRVALWPSGELAASATLDLSRPDSVPFELGFSSRDADVETLADQLGLGHRIATGSIDLGGRFSGRLQPERPLFADIEGVLSLEARDGSIRRALGPVAALALASDSLDAFAPREEIRYSRVTTSFEFGGGAMTTESFSLDGPDLRLFASGQIDVVEPPHEIDAQVALFLFRQLDRALDKIPILNLLLLGTNRNLVAAYYELSGPISESRARLVPLRTLAVGPAKLVFRDLPSVVMRGLRALGGSDASDGDAAEDEDFPFAPYLPADRSTGS